MSAGSELRARLDGGLQEGTEWTEVELEILALAEATADHIAALEVLLAEQGATITGSTGQVRLSPIFAELRQQRASQAGILSKVSAMVDQPKSLKAQKAADTRWGRGRGRAS